MSTEQRQSGQSPPSPTAHRSFDGQVLSTLNTDGSRRWLRPQVSPGRFHTRRIVVGWLLIALFVFLPFIEINGKPSILLDLVARRFTFFGATFLPSDTVLLLFFMIGIFVSIFLVTALFGRVWCGWGCPQTVYLELLFRPLERLIEGGRTRSIQMDRNGWSWRRWLKLFVYALLAVALANVFLAYFVGVETLSVWMRQSPLQHPQGFSVVAVTAGLIFFDFAYFREQMCTVICPYARLQSVLLDRKSLIVGYDSTRGEPRGKSAKGEPAGTHGDCIDCRACVTTCPTGIDIRDGLQLECVACAQCVDACDSIMDKIGKPRGLVRYASQDGLAGKASRLLRPRVVIYPLLVVAAFSAVALLKPADNEAKVTLLRGIGAPFSVSADGTVTNTLRVKIANRDGIPHDYTLSVEGFPEATLIAPMNPLTVAAGGIEIQTVFLTAPASAVKGGEREFRVKVDDGAGYESVAPYRFLAPESAPATPAGPSTSEAGGGEAEAIP